MSKTSILPKPNVEDNKLKKSNKIENNVTQPNCYEDNDNK